MAPTATVLDLPDGGFGNPMDRGDARKRLAAQQPALYVNHIGFTEDGLAVTLTASPSVAHIRQNELRSVLWRFGLAAHVGLVALGLWFAHLHARFHRPLADVAGSSRSQIGHAAWVLGMVESDPPLLCFIPRATGFDEFDADLKTRAQNASDPPMTPTGAGWPCCFG